MLAVFCSLLSAVAADPVARFSGGTTVVFLASEHGAVLAGEGATTVGGVVTGGNTRKVHQISETLMVGITGRTGYSDSDGAAIDLESETPGLLKDLEWNFPRSDVDVFVRRLVPRLKEFERGVSPSPINPRPVQIIVAGRSRAGRLFAFYVSAAATVTRTEGGNRLAFAEPEVRTLIRTDPLSRLVLTLDPRISEEAHEILNGARAGPPNFFAVRALLMGGVVPRTVDVLRNAAREVVEFTIARDARTGGEITVASVAQTGHR